MQTRDAQRLLSSRYAPEIVQFDLDPPLQHIAPWVLDVPRLERWFAGIEERSAFKQHVLAIPFV